MTNVTGAFCVTEVGSEKSEVGKTKTLKHLISKRAELRQGYRMEAHPVECGHEFIEYQGERSGTKMPLIYYYTRLSVLSGINPA